MAKIIIIGGLIFTPQILQPMIENYPNVSYIDINKFDNINSIHSELYSEIQVANNIIIIAYSAGGVVAVDFIIKYQPQIQQLILMNSAPCFIANDIDNWHGLAQADLLNMQKKLSQLSLENFLQSFAYIATYPQRVQNKTLENLYSRFCNKKRISYWLQILLDYDLRIAFSQLNLPILIILSKEDNLVSINNEYQNIKVKKIILANATHVNFVTTELQSTIKGVLNGY